MSQAFTTIPDVILQQVSARPDQAAIIETRGGSDVQVTYRELDELSAAFAQKLLAEGVQPGDSVLVFVPMSVSLYACLLGIFRMGATALFLDPSAGLRHIGACCGLRAPKAFLGSWKAHLLRLVSPALRAIPHHFWISSDHTRLMKATRSVSFAQSLPSPQPQTAALITFTSGSTGVPKAVVRTHRFLIAQHQALEEAIELQPGQRDLVTLPVFVLANLASGVTSILPDSDMARPGKVNPQRIAAQVQRYQPDRTCGSPAFYSRLLKAPPEMRLFDTFRSIYTGGAPVFPSLLQQLQARSPKCRVVAVYGSTEAEPIAHIPSTDMSAADVDNMRNGKGLLTGSPVRQTTLKIIRCITATKETEKKTGPVVISRHDFLQNEAAIGEPGEILVSGDHVLKGYLKGVGDSETKCSVDGEIWHRTGDAGCLDEQGRIWLLGRFSAKVSDERGTLYPFAVECVAQTYAFVERSAFIGRQGKRLLVVQYKGKPSEAEVEALRKSLSWTQIDDIISVAVIPVDKRHNAKVDYPALYKLLKF